MFSDNCCCFCAYSWAPPQRLTPPNSFKLVFGVQNRDSAGTGAGTHCFLATLEITNNEGDADDNVVFEDVTNLFFVKPPLLTGIANIDGQGLIEPGETARIESPPSRVSLPNLMPAFPTPTD